MRDMITYGLHDQMMEDFMKVWSNNGLGWQRSKHASVQDPNVIRFMLARLIYIRSHVLVKKRFYHGLS